MKFKTLILDENSVNRTITRLSHEILEKNKGAENLALIGIKTRGVPFANILAQNVLKIEGTTLPVGELDITLYRDDLSELCAQPTVNSSKIDFDVKNKDIILCDDVIFTGRTVRAAIEAIMKLGRPKSIQLAVIVDRGHRELPIRPDFVGKNIPTSLNEVVAVKFKTLDQETSVSLYEKN